MPKLNLNRTNHFHSHEPNTNIGVHFRISDDSSLATTSDPYLPAESVETFALSAGDHFSIIRPAASSSTGICTVTIVA